MKKLTRRRLSLDTTMIRELSSPHLQRIVGGITTAPCNPQPTNTCPPPPTNQPTACDFGCHTHACPQGTGDCYTTK
jgi:hypothetical protein